jgi:hypothetical protein
VFDDQHVSSGFHRPRPSRRPRQTLPILAIILLEGDAETVRVTATDLEVGAFAVGRRYASVYVAEEHRDLTALASERAAIGVPSGRAPW